MKKLIKIIDIAYWFFLFFKWLFIGLAEMCSAASGILKEFTEDEKSDQ